MLGCATLGIGSDRDIGEVSMELYEALYTTRMMRRMGTEPVPLQTQARIIDAAIRAPNGGNAQRWHFLVIDDPIVKQRVHEIYGRCRELEYADIAAGTVGRSDVDADEHARTMAAMKRSGDYFTEHLAEVPIMLFVFAIDDHGGANIYPAIWSALLAAHAEGLGGVITTVLRYEASTILELLDVPRDEGWQMTAMIALGRPLGRWAVAANRRPVHEVSSRNGWTGSFGLEVTEPMWQQAPSDDRE